MGYKPVAPDPWDYSAGVLMVRNAGGKVTDLQGIDIDPLSHRSYLVASWNPAVHEATLLLLGEYGVGSAAAGLE